MKTVKILGLGLLLAATLQVQAAGAPEDLARQWCANCHSVDGNSTSSLFPRLAGQQRGYLVQQLLAFRSKNRSDQAAHDYMWGMSAPLDDATIDGLASYFSGQTPSPNPLAAAPALLAAGEQIYKNGNPERGTPACMACHGALGEGSAIAPRLAGQHAAYLIKQLHVFETPQRPAAVAMQAFVKTLNEQDIAALAAYLQNLH